MKAPFPWFGGKRRVAHIVWERFGDVPNYVEPFAATFAVGLERPHEPRCETINDLDCYVANFWSCFSELRDNPNSPAWKQVAEFADWPVSEADLHARHLWLVQQTDFRERMKTDPHFFDPKVAGWWVWGLSQWIGGGWCSRPEWTGRAGCHDKGRGINSRDRSDGTPRRGRPFLTNANGQGVTNPPAKSPKLRRGGNFEEIKQQGIPWRKSPIMKRGGVGVQRRRPMLIHSGQGVHRTKPNIEASGVHRQVPDISGDSGAYGRGVHASGLEAKTGGLFDYFAAIAHRMRRVRVCCGDWKRVLGHSPTTAIGVTAVFLDPPYAYNVERVEAWVRYLRRGGKGKTPAPAKSSNRDPEIYSTDRETKDIDRLVAEVRLWAIEAGKHPKMRVALCGFEGEHTMPKNWECVAWQTNGGYANQSADTETAGKKNKGRERIWFSPHCLNKAQEELFKL